MQVSNPLIRMVPTFIPRLVENIRKNTVVVTIILVVGAVFAVIGMVSTFKKLFDRSIAPIKTPDQAALTRYFELLDKHPQLKRTGDLNDHRKGAYEIFYDPQQIESVRKQTYDRLIKKNYTPELAQERSRIGVVAEDDFWLWIRDAVKAPSGFEHTYNRIITKNQLNGVVGAAVCPFKQEGNGYLEVTLILAFRHATNSWELELPRGGGKPGEDAVAVAKREMGEETGEIIREPELLGSLNPDSGLVASVVPIFAAEVTGSKEAKPGKKEAIAGKYTFSLPVIEKAVKAGYMDITTKEGSVMRVNVRDPFLIAALYHRKIS